MTSILIRTGLLVMLLAGSAAAPAQAADITFQVRMSQQILLGAFDPAGDFVDVAGTFNDWGTNPLTPLADADGDSIYEITLDGFTPSEAIEFKFRINGQWDGTEEFPGVGNNRVHTVSATGDTILVWYNDQGPPPGLGEVHWWNDRIFYEIFVRSFYDSDGDGIGDFAGLTQKLDYLNDGDPATGTDLGVTGIWLMPINDSPSYHGYDTVDYRSINPDYGTLADFEAFLAAAHSRGIKVIIDYVMNHCSDQHPWFVAATQNDPTYRDYFRWSPYDPGYSGPWGQTVWHWDSSGWYYGLFTSGMPDLNYDNSALKTWMFDTATYWLDTVGVDGFRLDAVLYIDEDGSQLQNTDGTFQFWQDFGAHVRAVSPEALTVGEAWTNSNTAVQYVLDDRLDLCFEFDLAYAMLDAVNASDTGWLKTKAAQVYSLYPYLQFATFLTNHDQDRVFTVLGENEGKARAAAGLYLTLPGVPFLYYGEEIGMTGSGDHLNIRTPMQWTDGANAGFTTGTPWRGVDPNYVQYNVADEEADTGSLLAWYKQLIRLRSGSPALRRGTHDALGSSASSVLAFLRRDDDQTLLCLVNTSASPRNNVTVTGSANSLTPGDYTVINLLDPGDSQEITVTSAYEIGGLDLAGYGTAAYEFPAVIGVPPDSRPRPDAGLRLESGSPNPFRLATSIRFTLPARAHVRVGVYDVTGREVDVILDAVRPEGENEVHWDGTGADGRRRSAGVYFVRVDAGNETRAAKVMLLD